MYHVMQAAITVLIQTTPSLGWMSYVWVYVSRSAGCYYCTNSDNSEFGLDVLCLGVCITWCRLLLLY